jgi:hypothetical protein
MDTNYHPKSHSIRVRNGSRRPSSGPQTLLPVNSQGDISIRRTQTKIFIRNSPGTCEGSAIELRRCSDSTVCRIQE